MLSPCPPSAERNICQALPHSRSTSLGCRARTSGTPPPPREAARTAASDAPPSYGLADHARDVKGSLVPASGPRASLAAASAPALEPAPAAGGAGGSCLGNPSESGVQ